MRFCLFFSIVFAPYLLFAQQKNIGFKRKNFKDNPQSLKYALDKLQSGNERIQNSDYAAALPYFLSADSINPYNADLNVKIGLCYLNTAYKPRCLKYFEKGYGIKKKISKRINFFLARGYQLNCQWDSALTEYTLALKRAASKDKKDIDKYIDECNNGKQLMEHPVKVTIENMGIVINSPYDDYRPLLTAGGNEMVYTSKRQSSNSGDADEMGQYADDIYIIQNTGGDWDIPVGLDPMVNSSGNDAGAYISPDGKTLYVIRDDHGKDIYRCSYSRKGWSEPVSLGDTINTLYDETSMCLSPDGKTLYFTSDRPGGIGGEDIYTSKLVEDSSWSSPVNMGSVINTPYNEDGVYMAADGKTLYFSSEGHNTMGGYDIFMTVQDDAGKWSEPENLGYPINTPLDDRYFSISNNGRYGYYARMTDSSMLDIYRISMDAFLPKEWVLGGAVIDVASRQKIKAGVELYDKAQGTHSPFGPDTVTGKYSLTLPAGHEYVVNITAKGYKDSTLDINVPDTTMYREISRNIALARLAPSLSPAAVKNDACIPAFNLLMERFKGLTKDTGVVKNALAHLNGAICLKEMKFTVQVGAFKTDKNIDGSKYGVKRSQVHKFSDYIIPATIANSVIHITVGEFDTYEEAKAFKMKLAGRGINGAFVTGFYNGKLVELRQMMHPGNS